MGKSFRNAITLVELLVVISLIGILVAFLLPAVQHSRESSRRFSCQNNLKQMGMGLLLKHDSQRAFPPGWVGLEGQRHEVGAGPGWGWASFILTQIEQGNLAESLDLHTSFMHEKNALARETVLPIFRCPSDISKARFELLSKSGNSLGEFPKSNYAANFGGGRIQLCASLNGTGRQCTGEPYDGVFFHNSSVSLADLAGKGSSKTILAGERDSTPLSNQAPVATWVGALWEAEGDFQRVLGSAMHELILNSKTGTHTVEFLDYSSNHGPGAYFVFADGHVEFLVKQMDDWDFVQLMTRFPEDDLVSNTGTPPVESPPVGEPGPGAPPVINPVTPQPPIFVPPVNPRQGGGCPICNPKPRN